MLKTHHWNIPLYILVVGSAQNLLCTRETIYLVGVQTILKQKTAWNISRKRSVQSAEHSHTEAYCRLYAQRLKSSDTQIGEFQWTLNYKCDELLRCRNAQYTFLIAYRQNLRTEMAWSGQTLRFTGANIICVDMMFNCTCHHWGRFHYNCCNLECSPFPTFIVGELCISRYDKFRIGCDVFLHLHFTGSAGFHCEL